MAYRLTPAERRALAMARVNRDNPLANYYQDNSLMQEQIQADRIQPQESDANALVRGVHTVGDIVGNVLTGALKGLEGIYDFGAGIVGGIGGIFDDDFRDRVKEHIATDYVGNSVGNFLQDLTDQSYLKEGGFVENVAGGIGQMLPALAAAGITGGGSLVSLGTLGVSAAGGGTEEAFNDGAGYYQGLGYGAVRGATEIATEKLLGGADKLITGRGLFEGVKIAKQGLGRVVSEAINEGAEEVASELVNPLTRSIYKGTDAFKEYGDLEYWKGVAEAGLVGGATSVAFGQTVGRVTGTSGKRGDINESLTEIKQANEKLANLQAEYNLTNDKRTKVNEIIKGNWANIERTLQSVNADKRQALIKQFNLENEVNEDGTIKDTFKQSLTAEMPENDYYNQSVSLQGNTEKTNKDLGTIKQGMANNLIDEANGIDEQKANEMVGDVSLFKGEMTDTEKQNRSKLMKALNVLNKKGNAKTTFAILNPNKYFSANVTDGTLYIGADSFKTDQWAKDLVHEVTHLEEGTEEYNKLVQELSSGDILIDDGNGGKISLVEKATEKVSGKGYVNAQQLDEILKKANNNEMLTAQEREVFNLFKSELTAHESELYLGSEEFIDRIIESDTSLAKKIFDKIFNTKQALQKVDKNNPEVKRLLKAEKLWLDASKRIGNVQLAKYIQGKEKELKENLENGVENEKSQFNLKIGNETVTGEAETTKNLVALHNLSEDKLLSVIRLGGFPMPSIAITKADIEHSNFGNITVVFGKETIDPSRSVNKVYDKDAWTPTFPQVDALLSGVDEEAERDIERVKEYEDYIKDINNFYGQLQGYTGETILENNDTDKFKRYAKTHYNGVLATYLKEKGASNIAPVTKEKKYTRQNISASELKSFINSNGYTLEQLMKDRNLSTDEFVEKYKAPVKELFVSVIEKENVPHAEAEKLFEDIGFGDIDDVFYDTIKFLKTNKETEIDVRATREKLLSQIDESELDKWIDEKFLNLTETVGIRNNKDIYAPSGTRRKFNALHTEYTLENIVKAMKSEADQTGQAGWFGAGVGSISAKLARKFRSIKDIKEASAFLKTDTDAYENAQKQANDLLSEIVQDLTKGNNSMYASTTARDIISEIADKNPQTKEEIFTYLSKESEWVKVTEDVAEKIHILFDALKHMPTDYFEAKPQRAVGLDEIKMVLIPDTASQKLRNYLKNANIPFQEYDKTEGRTEAIKKLDNVRFNLKSNPQISLSNGEIRKLVANYTRAKVYSRKETEMSINNLIEELGELFTTEKISLKGKSKEEAIQMLWQGLNTVDSQDRQAFAEKVAEYIIRNSIVESTYKDADYDYYADVYNVLHSYVQKFNLDHIKTEIEHKYGKEKAKGIIARWQSKDGTGMSVDGYAEEINELGFRIDETKEAEILFAINDAYEKSLEKLKPQVKQAFNEFLNDSEAVAIKGALTQEILKIADTKGQKSTKTVVEQEINKVVSKYTDIIRNEHDINKVSNRVIGKVKKIAEFKEGVFWNSTQYKTDELKKSVGKLSRLIVKNNINVTGSRKVFAEFLQWYRKDNPMLEGWYDKNIANAIFDLAYNFKALNEYQEKLIKELKLKSSLDSIEEIYKWYTKKNLGRDYDSFVKYELKKLNTIAFTYEEISNIEYILDHINKFAETYKKVWRNGKLVEAAPIAEEYIKIIKKNEPVKVGWLKEHWRKYIKTFGDPMAFARYLDRYNKNGFYTQMLQLMREGATKASVMEMEFRTELDAFLKKHSKWAKNLEKRTVTYNGVELPMPVAISLYMTLNREQAQLGLAESGFVFHDVNKKNNKVVVKGFAQGENLTQEELTEKAQEQQKKLAEGFNETEFEYMAIVVKIFNIYCKKAKMETDKKTKGYTNVIDGYYFPVARYGIAKSIDQSDLFDQRDRVSNMSFNKETVKGAKGQLLIDDVFKLADAHIRGISMYSGLADVIQTYDVVFNLDVSGNPNQSVSVKTAGEDYIYDVANEYFAKMLTDIQGIKEKDTVGSRWLSNIRGNYVRFQLGLNPKTLVTQLSSLIASTSILDYGSIVKGIAINGKDVDKYSPLAMLRNYDQTAYKAEGVLEKTGGLGDKLMKPIGWMDRFTITKLFGACQVQIEKDGGAKVGTEANKIEAGKLLEQVIYETQQNSLATERSAAMRSRSEIVKSLVMFSSDAMKVAGRFIDSVGEYVTIKAQLKIATDKAEINALNDSLKSAKKKLGKSTGALIGTSIFMALVAQAFRYAFAKDDEDDNVVKNMTVDALGNMLGGFPLLKDFYTFVAQGFDMDMYAYSTFNDVLKSAKKIMSIDITDLRSITSSLKDISFSVGQLFGLPTRNVYNTLYGITKRFSPETAYKIDNILYKPSFKADLQKAIENDDDDMISVIAGLMLDENIGGMNDADARHTMTDLIGKGYDILPRSVGDTITYDDETYELTNRQKNQFKKVYNASNEAVANMVKLAQFKEASDDVKAKAIKYIYNVYYNLALQDFLGVSLENKNILFAEAIDIEKLALISASANSIKADTDKNGKQVSGSRKKKIQEYVNSLKLKAVEKYMVMGYLGYSNIYGENQVKAYINRLKLSKDEKSLLLEYSGYKTA